jgi:hypothetical protein
MQQQQQQLSGCFIMPGWPTAAALSSSTTAAVWVQLDTAAATIDKQHLASIDRLPAAAA